MSSSNQTLVAEDEPKAVESEPVPVPVPTEQNLGGNTEEGVVGVEEEGKGGSFGAQLGEVEETEKTQFGEDGNSGVKLEDDDDDEKREGKELEGRLVISSDGAGDGEAVGVQGEEETASGGKDSVAGEGSEAAAVPATEENKVQEEVKEEEGEGEEVAVSEVKEDGQTEGAVVEEVDKPGVVVSPPVESVPEEVTGTAGSDTFVANGVGGSGVSGEESGVLEGGSENLVREVEAEDENVPTGLNESEEPSIKNEGKNDDVAVKGDESEEPSIKSDDVVVKGDELEEPSTENEGKSDDIVVKGDESEEPSTENEGKNDDVVVKGGEVEEGREAEDGGNYEAVLTGDELEEDEIEGLDSQPARVAILEKTEAEEIMREIEEANAGIDLFIYFFNF